MSDSNSVDQFYSTLARVLLRCWIFGLILLVLSVGVIQIGGGMIYGLNERMFGLARHELEIIIFSLIALIKSLVLVFFFIPWLAIRLR